MTDAEKVATLDIAYTCKVVSKAAQKVADCLTAIELNPDTGDAVAEEKLRQKLEDARSVLAIAVRDARNRLDEPVPNGRSALGPIFDK